MRRKQMKIHEIRFCPAWITRRNRKALKINALRFLFFLFCTTEKNEAVLRRAFPARLKQKKDASQRPFFHGISLLNFKVQKRLCCLDFSFRLQNYCFYFTPPNFFICSTTCFAKKMIFSSLSAQFDYFQILNLVLVDSKTQ